MNISLRSSQVLVSQMEMLLNEGADVNSKDKDGWTALMYAVSGRHLKSVQLLLDKGADINVKNRWGDTALMMARREGTAELAELLKAHGAKE